MSRAIKIIPIYENGAASKWRATIRVGNLGTHRVIIAYISIAVNPKINNSQF